MNYYIDMDGVLVKYERAAYTGSDPQYKRPGFHYFRNLKPDPRMLLVINKLLEKCRNEVLEGDEYENNIFVLTSVTNTGSLALEQIKDKIEWLNEVIPNFDTKNNFIASITDKRNLAEAIKFNKSHISVNGKILSVDDILIDDYNANLINWQEAGGTAIKYNNGINDPTSFSGLNLDVNMSPDDIVELLTEHLNYLRKE